MNQSLYTSYDIKMIWFDQVWQIFLDRTFGSNTRENQVHLITNAKAINLKEKILILILWKPCGQLPLLHFLNSDGPDPLPENWDAF